MRTDIHLNLLGRPWYLRWLLRLARPCPHRVLEVPVHRIVQLPLPLRQCQRVEVQRLALAWPEVLALPLLDGILGLEVRQVFEVQAFVLRVELCSTFLAAVDDGVNVVVDRNPVGERISTRSTSIHRRDVRVRRVHDFFGTVGDHLQQLLLVRSWSAVSIGESMELPAEGRTFALRLSPLLYDELVQTQLLCRPL